VRKASRKLSRTDGRKASKEGTKRRNQGRESRESRKEPATTVKVLLRTGIHVLQEERKGGRKGGREDGWKEGGKERKKERRDMIEGRKVER
jgi:hypothetical protein